MIIANMLTVIVVYRYCQVTTKTSFFPSNRQIHFRFMLRESQEFPWLRGTEYSGSHGCSQHLFRTSFHQLQMGWRLRIRDFDTSLWKLHPTVFLANGLLWPLVARIPGSSPSITTLTVLQWSKTKKLYYTLSERNDSFNKPQRIYTTINSHHACQCWKGPDAP